jgi:predicted ester cyclase/quinol monooxygenase YgiN
MWAQLIKSHIKPGKEGGISRVIAELEASEQPNSGLIRSTAMRDQKDPSELYMLAVFESEEKARERERDPRRQEGLRKVRDVMAEAFDDTREFVDLTVVNEFTPGGTEDNVALFRQFIDEVVNQGNLDIIDQLFSPDFVEHEELPPGMPANREGVKLLFTQLHGAFSNLHGDIEGTMAQDDRVMFRMRWHATHTGDFFGVPPTGKDVSFQVIDEVRVENGKLVEHWGLLDLFGIMSQLGVIPAPAGAPH